MVITPLQCVDFLQAPKEEKKGEFDRPLFSFLRRTVQRLIRFRLLTALCLGLLLVSSVYGFSFVKQMFFPESTRPQMMIDFWQPAGTDIQKVAQDVAVLEQKLKQNPDLSGVSTFIGSGPPRFYLPVEPEKPTPNYAQLILNFKDYKQIDPFIEKMKPWAEKSVPGAVIRFRKYSVGPGDTWPFEARLSSPGRTNLIRLKEEAQKIEDVAFSSPLGTDWRTDMMNPVLKVVPEYDQKKGRWTGVNRLDLANATQRGYDGFPIGLYREKDTLMPILLRNQERERNYFLSNINLLQIRPAQSTQSVPLSQVVKGVVTEWEDPYLVRWNRRRAITIQGAPRKGVTYSELRKSVTKEIDVLKFPPGFQVYWDGEESSSQDAKKSLIPGIVPAVVAVLFLLVLVFNAARPILIIFLTIPFAFIGGDRGAFTLSNALWFYGSFRRYEFSRDDEQKYCGFVRRVHFKSKSGDGSLCIDCGSSRLEDTPSSSCSGHNDFRNAPFIAGCLLGVDGSDHYGRSCLWFTSYPCGCSCVLCFDL